MGTGFRGAVLLLCVATLMSCTTREEYRALGDRPPPSSITPTVATFDCPGSLEWCRLPERRIPDPLRRPLHLPEEPSCRTTPGRTFEGTEFGGTVLGRAPVVPLVAPATAAGEAPALKGVLRFLRSSQRDRWLSIKTLWFAFPRYQGPVWIRARRLDGRGVIRFGESPSLVDPFLPEGPTINGTRGFREWPGATWIKSPGCYAWQVDGVSFSRVIVFRATTG